jgi:hypothetical protein
MTISNSTSIISPNITELKIQGFKELESGWHYGEGISFGQAVTDDAIALIKEANHLGFYETDAFPGVNGEIMVTIYFKSHYLEFIVEPNGSVTFSHEEGNEEVSYYEGLSISDAKLKIKEYRDIWRQFDSLTQGTITTIDRADLRALHSETAETFLEFQLSVSSVFFSLGKASAPILEGITRGSQVDPLYSGNFQQIFYPSLTN